METDSGVELINIKDEDLLRNMWLRTEDFSRKKEIRAHMYKLREERLRNFYVTDDAEQMLSSHTTRTTSKSTDRNPSHEQLITDQSYQSFKTKEVRDSESPTRDHKHRTFDRADENQGQWKHVVERSSANEMHEEQSEAVVVSVSESCSKKETSASQQRIEQKAYVQTFGNEVRVFDQEPQTFQSAIKTESESSKIHDTKECHSLGVNQQTRSTDNQIKDFTESKHVENASTEVHENTKIDLSAATTISKRTDYPDPNTKVTTEVRELPDGTIVTSKSVESHNESHTGDSESGHTIIRQRYTEDNETRQADDQFGSSETHRIEQHTEHHSSSKVKTDLAHDVFARSLRSVSPPNGGMLTSSRTTSTKYINSERSSPSKDSSTVTLNDKHREVYQSRYEHVDHRTSRKRSTPGQSPERAPGRRESPSKASRTVIPSQRSPDQSPERLITTTEQRSTTVVKSVGSRSTTRSPAQSPERLRSTVDQRSSIVLKPVGRSEAQSPERLRTTTEQRSNTVIKSVGSRCTTRSPAQSPERPRSTVDQRSSIVLKPVGRSPAQSPERLRTTTEQRSTTVVKSVGSRTTTRSPAQSPERMRSTTDQRSSIVVKPVGRSPAQSPERFRSTTDQRSTTVVKSVEPRSPTRSPAQSPERLRSTTVNRSTTVVKSEGPRSPTRIPSAHSPERNPTRRSSPSKKTEPLPDTANTPRRYSPTKSATIQHSPKRVASPSPPRRKQSPSKNLSEKDQYDGCVMSASVTSTKTFDITSDTDSITTRSDSFYLSSKPDDEPTEIESKRPPLVRSETYEERCRQILGMADTTNTTTKRRSIDSDSEILTRTDDRRTRRVREDRREDSREKESVITTDLDDEDDYDADDVAESADIRETEDTEDEQDSWKPSSRRASTITIELTKPVVPVPSREDEHLKSQVELLDDSQLTLHSNKRVLQGTKNALEEKSVKELLRNDVEIFIDAEKVGQSHVKTTIPTDIASSAEPTKTMPSSTRRPVTKKLPSRDTSLSPVKKRETPQAKKLPNHTPDTSAKLTVPRNPSPTKETTKKEIPKQTLTSKIVDKRSISPLKESPTKKPDDKGKSIKKAASPASNSQVKHVTSATITLSPVSKRRIVKTNTSPISSHPKESEPIADKPLKANLRKSPVTERKDSAPVYGTKQPVQDTTNHKITRSSTSDGVLRNVKKTTKTEPSPPKAADTKQRPAKCIATKTLNLRTTSNTLRSDNLENVYIDIQQAKSSREPSPDRIVPTPVSPDEDTGCPRFPDTVVEPDENQHFSARSHHFEQLSRRDRCHITEVDTNLAYDEETRDHEVDVEERRDEVDKTLQNDVCLLSVHDKVRKVISDTAELNRTQSSKPLPETLDSNVSSKVSQFITIAENLRKTTPSEPFHLKPKSVYSTTKVITTRPTCTPADHEPSAPELIDLETKSTVDDECLLSVSAKINRFTAAVEQISSPLPQKSPTLVAKIERKISRIQEQPDDDISVPAVDRYRTDKQYALRKLSQEDSAERHITTYRRPSKEGSIEPDTISRRGSKDSTTNQYRRGSKDEHTIIDHRRHSKEDTAILVASNNRRNSREKSPGRPTTDAVNRPTVRRGSDELRRVKSIFENRDSTTTTGWEQRRNEIRGRDLKLTDIGVYKRDTTATTTSDDTADTTTSTRFSDRPSSRSTTVKKDLSKSNVDNAQHSYTTRPTSGDDVEFGNVELSHSQKPHVATVTRKVSSVEQQHQQQRRPSVERSQPDLTTDVPANVRKLDSDKPSYMSHTVCSLEHIRRNSVDQAEKTTKRTVEMEQTDGRLESQRAQRSPTARRPSSTSEMNFEEIFDLEELEALLEAVVGYEQRRRIRAQIRLVKRQQTAETETKTTVTPKHQYTPAKTTTPKIIRKDVEPKSYTTEKQTISEKHSVTEKLSTAERQFRKESEFIENPTLDPAIVRKLEATRFAPVEDTKPVWATKNILKKPSENAAIRKVVTVKKVTAARTQPVKTVDLEEVDCVTSSYGIGPTDDDGKPLFGISALKRMAAKHSKVTTTVSDDTTTATQKREQSGYFEKATVIHGSEIVKNSSDGTTITLRSDSAERDVDHRSYRTTSTALKKISLKSIDYDGADDGNDHSSTNVIQQKSVSSTTRTATHKDTKSFLNTSGTKVTGFRDIMEKMSNADNVREEGDADDDQAARALLNKFLGASLFLTGMESMGMGGAGQRETTKTTSSVSVSSSAVHKQPTRTAQLTQSSRTSSSVKTSSTASTTHTQSTSDLAELKALLEDSTDYEERRQIRAQIRQIMADKATTDDKAVASVAVDLKEVALSEDDDASVTTDGDIVSKDGDVDDETHSESESSVTVASDAPKTATATSSASSLSSTANDASSSEATTVTATPTPAPDASATASQDKTDTPAADAVSSTTTTTTTKTTVQKVEPAKKPVSPFAKFQQMDRQLSSQSAPNTPGSPATPKTPGGGVGQPMFRFTDPALSARAATVKDILLQWCQSKTVEYENIQITNFSTAWSDGLAFCALIHHFLPDSFDYSVLTPKQRRHNFTLAFRVADEKAGIAPLLDVEDMVVMRKPDWKCVFTYVQSIHRRFKNVQ